MGEQVSIGIDALVAQRSPAFLGCREHRTIGRDDVTPGFVEVTLEDPRVPGVVGQICSLEHLHLVELHEQDEIENHEDNTESAYLSCHGATAG